MELGSGGVGPACTAVSASGEEELDAPRELLFTHQKITAPINNTAAAMPPICIRRCVSRPLKPRPGWRVPGPTPGICGISGRNGSNLFSTGLSGGASAAFVGSFTGMGIKIYAYGLQYRFVRVSLHPSVC